MTSKHELHRSIRWSLWILGAMGIMIGLFAFGHAMQVYPPW